MEAQTGIPSIPVNKKESLVFQHFLEAWNNTSMKIYVRFKSIRVFRYEKSGEMQKSRRIAKKR